MDLLLTDRLACPRCGPEFGLILLADALEARRVIDGHLGCSNCRDKYTIRAGFGDLRPPPRGDLPGPSQVGAGPADDPGGPPDDEVIRLGAALGVTGGPGHIVLVDRVATLAPALSRLIPEVEIVAIDPATSGWEAEPKVSRMVAGDRLPFFTRALRAVAIDGADQQKRLAEANRVTGPGGRVVVLDPSAAVIDAFGEAGLEVVLDDPRVAVGVRRS